MDKGEIFAILLNMAVKKGVIVKFAPLQGSKGRIAGNRLAIKQDMSIDDIIYSLAHELAHVFLHYDKGNTIDNVKHIEYEEQADRAAKLLLFAISKNESIVGGVE